MEYVIAVKHGNHKYLFDWIKGLEPIVYKNVPLNDTNHDDRVNVLEAWEDKKDGGRQYFT